MFQQGYGELTAEDVKFSYERFNNPAAGAEPATYAKDWGALDHVEVIDTHTGRIILKNPAPALWVIALSDVSGCIVSKKAFEELGEKVKTTGVIGAGPYMLAEWKPNESITLRADPDYSGTPALIKEIVLRPIQEPKTAQLAFRSDELHFTKLDDPAGAEALADDQTAEIIKLPSINYVWVGMNVEKKPLDDVRVRQAIRMAIDVDQAILAGYNGTVTRANALMAPGLLGNWADAPVHQRDVEGAKKLLADAGITGGLDIRLTVLNQSHFVTIAQVIQANLAEVGINLNVEVLDGGAYWSHGRGRGRREPRAVAAAIRRQARPLLPDAMVRLRPGRRMELAALEEPRLRQAQRRGRIDHRRGEAGRALRADAEAHGRIRRLCLAHPRGQHFCHQEMAEALDPAQRRRLAISVFRGGFGLDGQRCAAERDAGLRR